MRTFGSLVCGVVPASGLSVVNRSGRIAQSSLGALPRLRVVREVSHFQTDERLSGQGFLYGTFPVTMVRGNAEISLQIMSAISFDFWSESISLFLLDRRTEQTPLLEIRDDRSCCLCSVGSPLDWRTALALECLFYKARTIQILDTTYYLLLTIRRSEPLATPCVNR
jgi:hypothetical protein